jgi:single-stranded-DNA-specific exonuclease
MASCGLAFYLVASLRSRLSAGTFDPRDLLDVVTLGTIADLVPLKDENRIFVSAGLRVLAGRRRPGLRALIEQAELGERDISERDVGFRLTPRLNSAGRLGDAQLALDLLLATDDVTGRALAAELEEKNRERQRIQEEVWQEALVAAAEWEHAPAIVVAGQSWHPGVLGIVAARLVDRFGKPAIAIGFGRAGEPPGAPGSPDGVTGDDPGLRSGDSEGRGSARTPAGLDLYGAVSACGDHLVRFGGHAGAAGLSIRPDQVASFRAAFLSEVERRAPERDDSLWVVDGVLDLSEVDVRLAEELSRLAPFGVANAEPVLAIPSVTALSTRVVGEKHLQLSLGRLGARGDAIAFHMAGADPGRGATLDLIAMADLDLFGGVRRARLRVKHLAASSASRDGSPDA